MVNPDCPKDCPRRHPGCQNPDTCESWRRYQLRKKAEDAAKYKRNREQEDYRAARLRARHWMGKE